MDFIQRYKPQIDERIVQFIETKKNKLSAINAWGELAANTITPFVIGGKTIRGSLLLYAHSLFSPKTTEQSLDAAAALELFQTGFLIHDDIMDQDDIRRGLPTIHKSYEKIAADRQGREPARFGRNMGINMGDLCLFLGYELIGGLPPHCIRVVQLLSREYSSVVIAQMQDVSVTHMPATLSQADILSLYRHKTARYSFSVPLGVGARLGSADEQAVRMLEDLGEQLGTLFQMRDDELGVGGDTARTGKSVGTDEKNHKQTLLSLLSSERYAQLKKEVSQKASNLIESLPVASIAKRELVALSAFCQNRDT